MRQTVARGGGSAPILLVRSGEVPGEGDLPAAGLRVRVALLAQVKRRAAAHCPCPAAGHVAGQAPPVAGRAAASPEPVG